MNKLPSRAQYFSNPLHFYIVKCDFSIPHSCYSQDNILLAGYKKLYSIYPSHCLKFQGKLTIGNHSSTGESQQKHSQSQESGNLTEKQEHSTKQGSHGDLHHTEAQN